MNNRFIALSFLLLAFFFSFSYKATATHIVGSDISYACTSTPGVFEVTLVIFRKCDGGSIQLCNTACGTACPQTMQIQGADPSCTTSTFNSISLSLQNVRDADSYTALCPTSKNACNNMGCATAGTFTPAVERYEFKGFANIGSTSGIPASCCNVRFSWSLCCRNSNISTGAADQNFYVDAVVNRCLSVSPCNSSPSFNSDPFIAICGNQNYIHNNSTFEPDGDSLSFAFTPALQGFGSSVSYTPPFAFDKPMPWTGNSTGAFPQGIRCDAINGDVMFTPPNAGGIFNGIIAIEVKQWKKINNIPTVIGITRRDIQIVILGDCAPNNPPRFTTTPVDSNINIPKTIWEVCAGNQLCFTITAKDTDQNLPIISDTTYLSWDGVLEQYGATFLPAYNPANRKNADTLIGGPREDKYQFCWTPTEAHARSAPYLFSVTGMDSRCPRPGRLRRGFSVKVNGIANVSITKTKKQCNKWQVSVPSSILQSISSSTLQISKQPFDYQFTNGAYAYTNTLSSADIPFTQGGNYLIKFTAVSGNCSKVFYDTLVVDTPLTASAIGTTICSGSSTTLSAIASKGKTPYQYRWFNSIKDTLLTPLNTPNFAQPSYLVTPTTSKRYTIQVKDSLGCTAYDSAFVTIANGIKNIETSNIKCNGENNGSIKVNPTDTIATYQYKLNTGVFQSSNIFTNLATGTYSITVKDTNNCLSVQPITLTQPALLKDTLTNVTNETCKGLNNGTITILAKGGVAPYKYSIDSIVFGNTRAFSNLVPQTYTIHLRDSNNCYAAATKTVKAADSLMYTLTIKQPVCQNDNNATGEIKISASGGKKPYTYKINTNPFISDSVFKNLTASTYTITLRDSNLCQTTFSVVLTLPTPLQFTTSTKHVTCFGATNGSITIMATGGTVPYTFKKGTTGAYQSDSLFGNLGAGLNSFTIKDSLNCTKVVSQQLNQPTAINASVLSNAATCYEMNNGKLTINTIGGIAPYQYRLDSNSYTSNNIFDNQLGGIYTVSVRDSLLCEKTFAATVARPAKVVGTLSFTSTTSCIGRADGSIIVTPTSGKSPFTFNINGSAFDTAKTFNNLVANTYTIGIKDSSSCSGSMQAIISNPAPISVGSITGPSSASLGSVSLYSVVAQAGLNYIWVAQKGTIISGKQTPTMNIRWDTLGLGAVGVAVYKDTACGDTASMPVTIGAVGLSELVKSWGLSIYPNPTKNILNINLQKIPEHQQIQLFDVQGKLLLQQELKLTQQLDIEKLAAGIYILKIGEWSGQVVKE